MRSAFVDTLVELAKNNNNLELITGDLGFGVLKPFWEQCPDQFTNAGVAEQNMVAVAAGMALEGKTVFVYSIANFPTMRCLEQIRNDCAYHNANVKIVCVGGGFAYGALGMSHQATEDIAIMRALPNMMVMAPSDPFECVACTKKIAEYKGPVYLRLGRGGEKCIHNEPINYSIGKAMKIFNGDRIAIFSTGAIFDEVSDAHDELVKRGFNPAVYSFPTIKPVDVETIKDVAKQFELIMTVEEHNIVGGFGSAVAEVLAEMNYRKAHLCRIGLNDVYGSMVGDQKYLRKQYGIDGQSIADRAVREVL